MLKIAIQKSGRLHEESIKLLQGAGIAFSSGQGRLRTAATNFPLELFFLRDDDIPEYVADGVADAGIVGENIVVEKSRETPIALKLGFGKCRLSIATPKHEVYTGINSLEGKRIATSYPNTLKQFLSKHGVQATLHEISGSVEIAPSIGLSDAVCDLVSSGSTLLINGLREVETILNTEAVLINTPQLSKDKSEILSKLIFRFEAVLRGRNHKYILLNAPNSKLPEILDILPGMKSPTIMPLADVDWSSVHSVVNEDDFWVIIESLRAAGAEGILVAPIEKMIL